MFVSEKASGEVVKTGLAGLAAFRKTKNPNKTGPSLAGFAAFLETKNPNEEYTWTNAHKCACAQYARTLGRFNEWMGGFPSPAAPTWYLLNNIARGNNQNGPHTIGETLERTRAALQCSPPQ